MVKQPLRETRPSFQGHYNCLEQSVVFDVTKTLIDVNPLCPTAQAKLSILYFSLGTLSLVFKGLCRFA